MLLIVFIIGFMER